MVLKPVEDLINMALKLFDKSLLWQTLPAPSNDSKEDIKHHHHETWIVDSTDHWATWPHLNTCCQNPAQTVDKWNTDKIKSVSPGKTLALWVLQLKIDIALPMLWRPQEPGLAVWVIDSLHCFLIDLKTDQFTRRQNLSLSDLCWYWCWYYRPAITLSA